jgi:hypothetical protein
MEAAEKQKIVDKVMHLRSMSIKGCARASKRAAEVKKYLEHDPYTANEKQLAEDNNKPLMRYNVIVGKLTTLLGNEQANRRTTKIIADYSQNEETIRLISDNFEYIKQREDLDGKLIKLLADALLYDTGGWLRRYVAIDELGYLTFKYKLYDTFSVHPDPNFREFDLSDCNWVVVDDWLTASEIRSKYKVSAHDNELASAWWDEVNGELNKAEEQGSEGEYKKGEKYLVCQLEELEDVAVNHVSYNGNLVALTDEELKKAPKAEISFLHRSFEKRVKYTTVVPHLQQGVVESKEDKLKSTRLSIFFCSTFDWNMKKMEQPSWGYLLLDPQDRMNKGKSQEVDYLIQRLGGIWHVPEHEKTAISDLKQSPGQPNAIVRYKSLKNKAQRDSGAADANVVQVLQNGVFSDMNFINEISTITAAMEGKGGKSAESGRLFEGKLAQSKLATNPYYELKAKVNELIVRDFLTCLPEAYFEDDRVLPLLKDNALRYEMVNLQLGEETVNDIRNIAARAVLDDTENVPSQQERAFNENMVFTKMLLEAGYPTEQVPFMLLVKNSTIRDKKDWMEALSRGQRVMQNRKVNDEALAELATLQNGGSKR